MCLAPTKDKFQPVLVAAGPDITPLTYTAVGATVAANGVVLVVSLARQLVTGRRWASFGRVREHGGTPPYREGGPALLG